MTTNSPSTPKSKINKFAENKYVIIVGILIALGGGIPGVLTVFDYITSKPDPIYLHTMVLTAKISDSNGLNSSVVFFIGKIFNDGKKALYYPVINLQVEYKGVYYYGKPYSIMEISSMKKMWQDKLVDTNVTELANVDIYEPGTGHKGGLLFAVPLTLTQLNDKDNLTYRFIINDVHGKIYNINAITPLLDLSNGNNIINLTDSMKNVKLKY